MVRRQFPFSWLIFILLCNPGATFQLRLLAQAPVLPKARLAAEAFGADAPWYLENIPFLEIDDPEIQRTFYYRWKVYRSHLRQIGGQGLVETEFLADVPWARHPYTDLNDSSSFHILEGRWLRNPAIARSLVDHLYTGGGNDRHFSESIAAATLAWTQVTGDPLPALEHLDTMEHVYSLWDDHFDARRGLYWIEPLTDATEYTIASIDASGAGFTEDPSRKQDENGFRGGYAYRPSINSYQYANAISQLWPESPQSPDCLPIGEYRSRPPCSPSFGIHHSLTSQTFTSAARRSFRKANMFVVENWSGLCLGCISWCRK